MKPLIFVSENIYKELKKQLAKIGRVITVAATEKCYQAVASHPDIQICAAFGKLLVDADAYGAMLGSDKNIAARDELKQLEKKGMLLPVVSKLGRSYPDSVIFNGKFTGGYWIHHLEHSHHDILKMADDMGVKKIHVNQGYTGCSLVMVGPESGVTADKGVHKTLTGGGFDVLLIERGHILLPGLKYGFIGGCAGLYQGRLYVNGDLSTHLTVAPLGNSSPKTVWNVLKFPVCLFWISVPLFFLMRKLMMMRFRKVMVMIWT